MMQMTGARHALNNRLSIILLAALCIGLVSFARHRLVQRATTAWPQARIVASIAQPHAVLIRTNVVVVSAIGGQATITAILRDQQGQPVMGAEVQFTSPQGSLSPTGTTTDAAGVATSIFTAGATPGQAVVMATCCGLSQSTLLEIRQPPATNPEHTIELNVATTTLAPGQQTAVTARLLDPAGRPLAGELITLFGSHGELAPASIVTDQNGHAQATYTAGNMPGGATITLMAGYATNSITLQITGSASTTQRLFLPLIME